MEKLQNNPTYKVATQLLKHTKNLSDCWQIFVDLQIIKIDIDFQSIFLSLNKFSWDVTVCIYIIDYFQYNCPIPLSMNKSS